MYKRPARSSMSTTPLCFLLSKRCVPTSLRMRAALTSNTSIRILSREAFGGGVSPSGVRGAKPALEAFVSLRARCGVPIAVYAHVSPSYESAGGVPAVAEVKFSLSSNRGCFGECSFCALTFHQGRIVQSSSKESLVEEAKLFFDDPLISKGYIHDVGGPTANFRAPACQKQMKHGACPHKSCLSRNLCSKLEVDHEDYLDVLRTLRSMPEVKKVFVRSGVRFDYALADPDDTFIRELCEHHASGPAQSGARARVRRRAVGDGQARKRRVRAFPRRYARVNADLGRNSTWFLTSCRLIRAPRSKAVELAEYCRDLGYMPEQVQDFTPRRPPFRRACITPSRPSDDETGLHAEKHA